MDVGSHVCDQVSIVHLKESLIVCNSYEIFFLNEAVSFMLKMGRILG